MCGRIYNTLSPQQVARLFGQSRTCQCDKNKDKCPEIKGGERCSKSYNAAPTRFMPIIMAPPPPKQPKDSKAKTPRKGSKSAKQKQSAEAAEEETKNDDSAKNAPNECVQCKVEIEAMKWGMIIPNSNDIVINGRLEELYTKPFFKGLLERKRCVITFNGYFEWNEQDKRAYLFRPKNAKMITKTPRCSPTKETEVEVTTDDVF